MSVKKYRGTFTYQIELDTSFFVRRLPFLSQLADYGAAQILDTSWHIITTTVTSPLHFLTEDGEQRDKFV